MLKWDCAFIHIIMQCLKQIEKIWYVPYSIATKMPVCIVPISEYWPEADNYGLFFKIIYENLVRLSLFKLADSLPLSLLSCSTKPPPSLFLIKSGPSECRGCSQNINQSILLNQQPAGGKKDTFTVFCGVAPTIYLYSIVRMMWCTADKSHLRRFLNL